MGQAWWAGQGGVALRCFGLGGRLTQNGLRETRGGSVDNHNVRVQKNISSRLFQFPFHKPVTEEFGRSESLNMCVLGAVARLIPIVSPAAMIQVISDRFDDRFRQTILSSFELGYGLVKETVLTFWPATLIRRWPMHHGCAVRPDDL